VPGVLLRHGGTEESCSDPWLRETDHLEAPLESKATIRMPVMAQEHGLELELLNIKVR